MFWGGSEELEVTRACACAFARFNGRALGRRFLDFPAGSGWGSTSGCAGSFSIISESSLSACVARVFLPLLVSAWDSRDVFFI
jgi:hypothetical protein